jgi:hypothetical protein
MIAKRAYKKELDKVKGVPKIINISSRKKGYGRTIVYDKIFFITVND